MRLQGTEASSEKERKKESGSPFVPSIVIWAFILMHAPRCSFLRSNKADVGHSHLSNDM